MINIVEISKNAEKDLKKLPLNIVDLFLAWVRSIQEVGLQEVRKKSSYHDEPLKGKWKGYRSVRMNRAYRVFYIVEGSAIKFVSVHRINKHDY